MSDALYHRQFRGRDLGVKRDGSLGTRKDGEGSDQVKDSTSMSNDVEELDVVIEAARRTGADVSEAESFSREATASLCLNREAEAAGFIQMGIDVTEKVHRQRVEQLLEEAQTVLEQGESRGADTVDSWDHLAKADEAFRASDYEATIWFLNMAIQSMGTAERLRSEAQEALAWNRWSFDKLNHLEPVSSPEADLIQMQECLVTQGDLQESLDMADDLEQRLAVRLANHTGVLLSEMRGHIDDLAHEDMRDEAKYAMDGYKLAQRYVWNDDALAAVDIIIRIELEHDEALRRRRKILVVG